MTFEYIYYFGVPDWERCGDNSVITTPQSPGAHHVPCGQGSPNDGPTDMSPFGVMLYQGLTGYLRLNYNYNLFSTPSETRSWTDYVPTPSLWSLISYQDTTFRAIPFNYPAVYTPDYDTSIESNLVQLEGWRKSWHDFIRDYRQDLINYDEFSQLIEREPCRWKYNYTAGYWRVFTMDYFVRIARVELKYNGVGGILPSLFSIAALSGNLTMDNLIKEP